MIYPTKLVYEIGATLGAAGGIGFLAQTEIIPSWFSQIPQMAALIVISWCFLREMRARDQFFANQIKSANEFFIGELGRRDAMLKILQEEAVRTFELARLYTVENTKAANDNTKAFKDLTEQIKPKP